MYALGKDSAVLLWGSEGGQLAGASGVQLDAASDEAAYIFTAIKDMTIDEVGLNITAKTGSPTYQISIQGVDAAGDPDGSIISSSQADFAPATTGFTWFALGADVSLTQNGLYAIVIEDGAAGTNPDGSNFCGFGGWSNNFFNQFHRTVSTDTGSTWTPENNVVPSFGVRNSATTDDIMGYPVVSSGNLGSIVSTVGHIAAQKININPVLGRRTLVGSIEIFGATTGNYKLGIYDSTGTAVAETAQLDDDAILQTQNNFYAAFSPVWLEHGVDYYVGIKLDEAAFVAGVYGNGVATSDNRSAFQWYASANMLSIFTTVWTDVTDEVAMHCLLGILNVDKHGVEMQHLEAGMVR